MTIYQSEKALPYVYMGIHKETGQFYIGSRTSKKIKLPPEQDLIKYRTSSKIVKPIFDQFDWYIIAMFFDPIDCYNFEQELIHNNLDNSLLINMSCYYEYKSFFSRSGQIVSNDTKLKMSVAKLGKKFTEEHKNKIKIANTGRIIPQHILDARKQSRQPMSDEAKNKIRMFNLGKKLSNETKLKMSHSWIIISPTGESFKITNLNKFCQDNNLCSSHMIKVANGKRLQHKGYKCVRVD